MNTLRITRGLPASGKTTGSKLWVAEDPKTRARVNRDDLRMQLFDTYETFKIKGAEDAVTAAEQAAVLALLKSGRDVVVDAMHLRLQYVRAWRRFAKAHGFDFEVDDYPISVDAAVARDALRARRGERSVGNAVILKQAKYLKKGQLPELRDEQEPEVGGQYVPRPDLPLAVVVDVDGTVAEMGDRNPHDLTRVLDDAPRRNVIRLVKFLRFAGVKVIFLSGREGTQEVRSHTEVWLRNYAGKTPDEPLFMRPEGDFRRDSIIKLELFDAHVRNHFNVLCTLDDRNQVVEMWRSIGLDCLQVAPGAF